MLKVGVTSATKTKVAAAGSDVEITGLRASAQDGPSTVTMNKDIFAWGRSSQLFAGLDAQGQTVVLKRISLLPPRHEDSRRAQIAEIYRERGDRYEDTSNPEALCELALARQAQSPLAPACKLWMTQRNDQISKAYLLMPPAAGDLLGAITSAQHRSRQLCEAVTVEVLCQLLPQFIRMHARGVVHGDVRAENILLMAKGDTEVQVVLWDFGQAAALAPQLVKDARVHDLMGLSSVALMLLVPERRGSLNTSGDVVRALDEEARLSPAIGSLLQALCAGAPASQLLERLREARNSVPLGQQEAQQVLRSVRHLLRDIEPLVDDLQQALKQASHDAIA